MVQNHNGFGSLRLFSLQLLNLDWDSDLNNEQFFGWPNFLSSIYIITNNSFGKFKFMMSGLQRLSMMSKVAKDLDLYKNWKWNTQKKLDFIICIKFPGTWKDVCTYLYVIDTQELNYVNVTIFWKVLKFRSLEVRDWLGGCSLVFRNIFKKGVCFAFKKDKMWLSTSVQVLFCFWPKIGPNTRASSIYKQVYSEFSMELPFTSHVRL